MSKHLSSVNVDLHLKTEVAVECGSVESEQDCVVLEMGNWPAKVTVFMTPDVALCISQMLAQHVQDRRAVPTVPIG